MTVILPALTFQESYPMAVRGQRVRCTAAPVGGAISTLAAQVHWHFTLVAANTPSVNLKCLTNIIWQIIRMISFVDKGLDSAG